MWPALSQGQDFAYIHHVCPKQKRGSSYKITGQSPNAGGSSAGKLRLRSLRDGQKHRDHTLSLYAWHVVNKHLFSKYLFTGTCGDLITSTSYWTFLPSTSHPHPTCTTIIAQQNLVFSTSGDWDTQYPLRKGEVYYGSVFPGFGLWLRFSRIWSMAPRQKGHGGKLLTP